MAEPMEPTEPPGGGSEPWKNPWVVGGVVAVIVLIVAGVAFFAMDDDEDDDVVADTATTEPEETPTTVDDEEEQEAEGPRTVTVQVDGELATDDHVAMLGYFPKEATVRQGDTIEFPFMPGDPHSVTFGTIVDEAFAEMDPAEPQAAFEDVPLAVNEAEMAVNQAGALPCYSGDAPPADGSPCEEQEQPEFTGSLAFYNSGLLNPDDTYTVDVADDADPGSYNYFCTLHGPAMAGTVTVVEADGEGQTAEEVEQARQAELDEVASATQPALEALSDGAQPGLEEVLPQGPDQLIAGGFVPEPVRVDVLEFWPDEVTVAAGESLTWNMLGLHTVSFNAPDDATPPIIPGEGGELMLNPLAFAPQGGAAGAPPPPPPPPEGGEGEGPPPEEEGPPPPPMVIEGGEFDGSGFFSSGVLPSGPPMLLAYEITFTTPGTYDYICTIHPHMEGTVTVE